jgi:phosphoribosyl-ATP pyrophosphohydrolase/phosphoribosyl-AMP cyclohydrolase
MKVLDTDSLGLVPVVVQDADSLQVLMVGFTNDEAIRITKEKGLATFWSRSRNELWTKGETSGNFLKIIDIKQDCDDDTLLYLVSPVGPTCHRGTTTCFD